MEAAPIPTLRHERMSARMPQPPDRETALAIICGGGTLPFALADAAIRRGRRVVLFALREWADPQRVAGTARVRAAAGRAAAAALLGGGLSARWCGLRSGIYGLTLAHFG